MTHAAKNIFSVRTYFLILLLLALIFIGTMSTAYWIQTSAQNELRVSLDRDLSLVTILPGWRDRFRHYDLISRRYIITGDKPWHAESARLLTEFLETNTRLQKLLTETGEIATEHELSKRLVIYLKKSRKALSEREKGRLSDKEIKSLSHAGEQFDAIIDMIVLTREKRVDELIKKREEADAALVTSISLIASAGLTGVLLLALYLRWYFVDPIVKLEKYLNAWKLNKPWDLKLANTG
ncbi:MAG: hypothetical protein ABIG11_02170 [bacterium]